MAITAASYTSTVSATEVLEVGVPAASSNADKEIRHNGFSTSINAFEGVTAVAYFEAQLTAGSGSIDFTALPQPNGASLDATGKVVKLIKVKAAATNAGTFAAQKGVSDGIDLGVDITALGPGKEVTVLVNDVEVEADAKVLDLSGTGTDKAQVTIWLGEPAEA